MINIRTIPSDKVYTYGSWTSQALDNSLAGFESGATNEWGYISWDETYTGGSYGGEVRIDILSSTDDSVIIADIAKNADGTPTDLSTTAAALVDIKIRVKLYALEEPTPKVSNLRINHKYYTTEQVVTDGGKNVLLNRATQTTPTTDEINRVVIGAAQTTDFSDSSTMLASTASSPLTCTTTFDSSDRSVLMETTLDETDTQVANGTVMNALAYQNTDSTPVFCAASRFTDITKSASYKYYIRSTYSKVPKTASSSVLTEDARNLFVNRCFYETPTYYNINRYVLGKTSALSTTMTTLDTVQIGPSAFGYSLLDTSEKKAVLRVTLDKDTGNGQTFTAIGHKNDDASPLFVYASTFDTMSKSSSYIFLYTVSYYVKPISESSIL